MTKHIVQVHPVENGEPNLYKVIQEQWNISELNDEILVLENSYSCFYWLGTR